MDYWETLTRRFKRRPAVEAKDAAAASSATIAMPALPDRRSPSWGKAAEWMNGRVPAGCAGRLKRLAEAHDLHRWQVLVAALDCFEATYGPGKPHSRTGG